MGIPDDMFVDRAALPEMLMCSICFDVLLEPQVTPCSHVFCAACISQVVPSVDGRVNQPPSYASASGSYFYHDQNSNVHYHDAAAQPQRAVSLPCPLCRADVRLSPSPTLQPAEILALFVESQQVMCSEHGVFRCNWIGPYKDWKLHLQQCALHVARKHYKSQPESELDFISTQIASLLTCSQDDIAHLSIKELKSTCSLLHIPQSEISAASLEKSDLVRLLWNYLSPLRQFPLHDLDSNSKYSWCDCRHRASAAFESIEAFAVSKLFPVIRPSYPYRHLPECDLSIFCPNAAIGAVDKILNSASVRQLKSWLLQLLFLSTRHQAHGLHTDFDATVAEVVEKRDLVMHVREGLRQARLLSAFVLKFGSRPDVTARLARLSQLLSTHQPSSEPDIELPSAKSGFEDQQQQQHEAPGMEKQQPPVAPEPEDEPFVPSFSAWKPSTYIGAPGSEHQSNVAAEARDDHPDSASTPSKTFYSCKPVDPLDAFPMKSPQSVRSKLNTPARSARSTKLDSDISSPQHSWFSIKDLVDNAHAQDIDIEIDSSNADNSADSVHSHHDRDGSERVRESRRASSAAATADARARYLDELAKEADPSQEVEEPGRPPSGCCPAQ